ncbi:MAG: hypothetical protein JSU75_04170 [Gammaproteobacteria bacterium]|nr:MAG: hypothetical protein JSU75_04170 [Gammaproteobacteria bacterium]
MTAGRHTLIATLVLLLAAGCSQQPYRPAHGTPSSLQDWLDTELAPYVSQQMGQHPRFKGEPVIIVRLKGDDIQPDIDGLTRSMRDQLMDSLLKTPGVQVPWQPQQQQAQHHRRLDQVQCGRIRDASYFIGIEITRTATAQFRVSVRALDVRAGEWVSGFSHHWSGNLTGSELRALQVRRTDESLRGLRVLPFSAGQPDLAATYLANNLSCLLRQQDVEDLKIKVAKLTSDQPQLRTLLRLIGNNLSRYREVQITDTERQANYILRGETHMIQPGLYQVWVILHPRGSGDHLAGMDTATYIRIPPAGNSPQKRSVAQENGRMQPAIARMELVRHANRNGYPDSCSDGQHGCPVLEVEVEQADAVFVIAHGTRDGISQLSAACDRTATAHAHPARYAYRFPEARYTASDWPTVYAIAVSGSEPERQFRQLLQELPDACSNASGVHSGAKNRGPWLDRLDRLIAANRGHAVWTARRLP